MEKIVVFLNKKWSIFIAFIPVVNILYLIFRFLTVRDKVYNISNWSLLPVAPLCLLYRIVPDSWNWVVTHLILSAIVLLIMRKSRGGYRLPLRIKFRWEAIFFCTISVFMLSTMGIWVPALSEISTVREATVNALEAIVSNDEELWQEQIHPVYGTELMCLADAKKQIISDDILLEGYRLGRFSLATYNVTDGKAVSAEMKLYIGGTTYRVKAVYQQSDNGSGFIDFRVIPE